MKKFKSGRNPRKYSILIMEKYIGRPILKSEPIHHIDFNRLNNSLNNLYLCKNASEHSMIHGSLEKTTQELFKKKIIIFINGKYQINKKKRNIQNLSQNQMLNKWL